MGNWPKTAQSEGGLYGTIGFLEGLDKSNLCAKFHILIIVCTIITISCVSGLHYDIFENSENCPDSYFAEQPTNGSVEDCFSSEQFQS